MERPELKTASAEYADVATELEIELDNELKLGDEEGWENEHDLDMKSEVTSGKSRVS